MAMRVKKDAIGQAIKQSYKNGKGKSCPVATMDVHVNLKNRNHAIKEYGYGPLNPVVGTARHSSRPSRCWIASPREWKPVTSLIRITRWMSSRQAI